MKRNLDTVEQIDIEQYLDTYEYIDNKNETENINLLSTSLIEKLKNNVSIRNLEFGSYESGYMRVDLLPWKLIALSKALETDNTIKKLILNDQVKDNDTAQALKTMLSTNTSIKEFHLVFVASYTFPNMIELIAEGIKNNNGIKYFEYYDEYSSTLPVIMRNAIKDNNTITHFKCKKLSDDLDDLLKFNKNITTIVTEGEYGRFNGDNEIKFDLLKEALNKNNNISKLYLDNETADCSIDELNTSIPVDAEVYNHFKKILENNKNIVRAPLVYIRENKDTAEVIKGLLNKNQDGLNKLIDFLQSLDDNPTASLSERISAMHHYEKVGKSLLREKLQVIDWGNNNLIREYAEIYNIEQLKQYDVKKVFTKFTPVQRTKFQSIFEQHVAIFDEGQDSDINALLHRVENYRNDNFFQLSVVTKNISEFGLSAEIWTHISSYLKFDDVNHGDHDPQIDMAGEL